MSESTGTSAKRGMVVAAGALALVVISSAVAYGVASSHKHTATIVKTVFAKPTTTTALKCVQGAAAGSCNVDEAKELLIPDRPLTAAQHALEAQQLVQARAAAMRYPTVADALRAHMLQAGKFSPLTGAHYINIAGMVPSGPAARYGTFDASNPGSLIYDGTDPTSKVIGVMYLSMAVLPPEGFAGPNDHWHRHTNTCVVYAAGQIKVPFPADSSVTKEMCDAKHGQFMRETVWMVHAWVVPGWESPRGVYSHDNPDVLCADGTTKADSAGFCQGA